MFMHLVKAFIQSDVYSLSSYLRCIVEDNLVWIFVTVFLFYVINDAT